MQRRLSIAFATALVTSQAHAAKIPQLDPTWFASQLFWLVLSFGVLLLVVKTQIHPTVRRVLDARDSAIQGALKEAESFKASAEAAKSNFEQANNDARNQAATLIAQTHAELTGRAAEEQAKLDAVLTRKLSDAEAATRKATEQALAAVAQPTASLVQTIAGKLLGKDVSTGDAESAVKKVA
jgi:F-type H+-transporting ATPase subunit b